MTSVATVIGIDIGGTKIHGALYQKSDFKMLQQKKVSTEGPAGFEAVLDEAVDLINTLKNSTTEAVGVGIPGYIDSSSGIVYRVPNIPFKGTFDLAKYFRGKINLPVVYDNDAALFTLAEFTFRTRKNVRNMLGITMGTGLGGGIIMNGELYRGHNGFAGEFGHALLGAGEFEDFVSAKGESSTRAKYLGILFSNLIQIFNPEVIALGGSVAKDFPAMEKVAWSIIRERNIPESYQDLDIHVSQLEFPGTLGAAFLASEKA